MSRTLLGLAVALALTAPAYAQSPELNELRAELSRMRQDYEDRIRQLEERLNRVEPAIAAKQPETPAATARADAGRGLHGANVGLVLNARYASLKRDPATYALPGFLLPKEAGPGSNGGWRSGERACRRGQYRSVFLRQRHARLRHGGRRDQDSP